MKRYIILLLTAICTTIFSQNSFYWHNGKKVSLIENKNKHFISFRNEDSVKVFNSIKNKNFIIKKQGKFNNKLNFLTKMQSKEKYDWKIVENLNKDDIIKLKNNNVYSSKSFTWIDGKDIVTSSFFYVKLKTLKDTSLLFKYALKDQVFIDNQNKYMPLWFTIDCKLNNAIDALDISNKWFETGLFEEVQPDFIVESLLNCVNDPNFTNQWGLNNIGQSGWTTNIDIKMCNARTITTGNQSVTIAVVDEGVELNHPDLANIHPTSFDGASSTSPSQVHGNHGIACAGIIGANTNNNLGVAGIAPNCRIMSISANFSGGINIYQQFADGINFSILNGVSVMSNSWGGGPPNALVDNAITNALTMGRNGLGIVMVFATGNNNGGVSWPANSNQNIISVGAISPCGQRKNPNSCDTENWWGSNFGNELDVMAHGVFIPTTDRQGTNGYNPNAGVTGDYAFI